MNPFTWLRRHLGVCQDRWRHTWKYQGENNRSCDVCNKRQVCVGEWQPDMDLAKMKQWADVEGGTDGEGHA